MHPTKDFRPSASATGAFAGSDTGPDDPRIVAALREYQAALDAGSPPDRAAFLNRYADVADQLTACLDGLDLMHAALPAADDGPMPVAAGVPLGDFQLIREVGRGGMGIVYEAEQLSLRRRVALKVLPFAATLDARQLQRFQNEATAAAHLHHPHIVPVYGVGSDRGVYYYAMQFIAGQTLADIICRLKQADVADVLRQEGLVTRAESLERAGAVEAGSVSDRSVTPVAHALGSATTRKSVRGVEHSRTVARWGVQAADALEHAHQYGIVHRDIKPANLLLDRDGTLFVADFGLAHGGGDTALTQTGDVIGTLRYMPPEQARGEKAADPRGDVYSLGVTLYELLTLADAFVAKDRQALLRQVLEDDPMRVRRVNRAVPPELEIIVHKAMSKSPADRYLTAKALADDLRAWLDDRPIKAKPPTVRQRMVKWGRRHPSAVGAGFVVLILAVAGLAISNVFIGRAQRQTAAALEQARKGKDVARRAVDDMWVSMAEKWLRDEPALEQTQRDFMLKALAFYEELAQEEGDDRAVQTAVGQAHLRVGAIHDRLGDLEAGAAAFQRAVDIFQGLAVSDPNNVDYRYVHAQSVFEYGGILDRVTGRRNESETICRQALDLFEKAATDFPADLRIRAGLADSGQRLASVNMTGPRELEIVRLLRRTLKFWPVVIAAEPGNSYNRYRFHRAQKLLTRYCAPDEAEVLIQHAVVGFEQLVREFSRECQPRRELAAVLSDWAMFLGQNGRPDEAVAIARRSLEIREKLVDDYPLVPAHRGELTQAHFRLGTACLYAGRFDEAEEILNRTVSEVTAPGSREWVMPDLAVVYAKLGLAREGAGRTASAVDAFDRAADLFVKRVKRAPSNQIVPIRSARGLTDLGWIHRRSGRTEMAEAVCVEARTMFEAALADSPDNVTADNDFAWFLATCPIESLRDGPRALQLAEKAVALKENASTTGTLGVARYRAGHYRAALASLDRSLRMQGGDFYATPLFFHAMARWQLGEKVQARQDYDQAMRMSKWAEPDDFELRQFQQEAAALLGVK